MIESARYTNEEETVVNATIDGVTTSVPLTSDGEIPDRVNAWIADGGVVEAYEAPAAERRLVPKSVILSRVSDAELEAALVAMTARQKERWRAPDKPAIYFDDEETIALLTAIGADPAVVLAP
jgi:hypothetical protein